MAKKSKKAKAAKDVVKLQAAEVVNKSSKIPLAIGIVVVVAIIAFFTYSRISSDKVLEEKTLDTVVEEVLTGD